MKEILGKLENIKESITREKDGVLRFFVLIERSDLDAKWDIVFSADWLEKTNAENDLVYLIEKLKAEFNGNLDFLARILMAKPEDLFIKKIAKAVTENSTDDTKEFKDLFIKEDLTIHHMFVIALDFEGIDLDAGVEAAPIGALESGDF